jgi:hypothetical protein
LFDEMEEWLLAHKEFVQTSLEIILVISVIALAFDAIGVLGRALH